MHPDLDPSIYFKGEALTAIRQAMAECTPELEEKDPALRKSQVREDLEFRNLTHEEAGVIQARLIEIVEAANKRNLMTPTFELGDNGTLLLGREPAKKIAIPKRFMVNEYLTYVIGTTAVLDNALLGKRLSGAEHSYDAEDRVYKRLAQTLCALCAQVTTGASKIFQCARHMAYALDTEERLWDLCYFSESVDPSKMSKDEVEFYKNLVWSMAGNSYSFKLDASGFSSPQYVRLSPEEIKQPFEPIDLVKTQLSGAGCDVFVSSIRGQNKEEERLEATNIVLEIANHRHKGNKTLRYAAAYFTELEEWNKYLNKAFELAQQEADAIWQQVLLERREKAKAMFNAKVAPMVKKSKLADEGKLTQELEDELDREHDKAVEEYKNMPYILKRDSDWPVDQVALEKEKRHDQEVIALAKATVIELREKLRKHEAGEESLEEGALKEAKTLLEFYVQNGIDKHFI